MANAIKDGLVAYYPCQSNAINMVDGVAGTINGTPSWVKNHAGKVVLDDTTASITHAPHAINTVCYFKEDGKFYAVLNGVPYMIDEELSSSFTSCANATMIGCNRFPLHAWIPSAENLYFDGSGYILLDTGTAASKYNLVGYSRAGEEASRTTITVEGGTTVPAISYNNARFWRGTTAYDTLEVGDYIEGLFVQSPYVIGENRSLFNSGSGSSGFTIYPGSASTISRIYQGVGEPAKIAYTTNLGSDARWLGLYIRSSTTVDFKISTLSIVTNSTSALTSTTRPLTIGSATGNSGAGGTNFATAPIGPVAHYKGVTPANYSTFLGKRLARVQAGTWQPYIPMEDLV